MAGVQDVDVDAVLREVGITDEPEATETTTEQQPEPKAAAQTETQVEPEPEPSPRPKVTPQEAFEERRRRREQKNRLAERERQLAEREAAHQAQVQKDRDELEAFRRAKATGDFDTLAKMLGFENEAEMSRAQVQGHADPTAKAVKELQHQLEARERREREREAKLEEQQARAQAEQERADYERTVATRVKQMTTLPAKLRVDPRFHEMVIKERDDQFDEELGETISVGEAAKICLDRLKEGRKALDDYLAEESPDQAGKPEKPTGGQPEATEKVAPKKRAPAVSQRDLSDISEEATVDDVGLDKILEIEGRKLQNSVGSR